MHFRTIALKGILLVGFLASAYAERNEGDDGYGQEYVMAFPMEEPGTNMERRMDSSEPIPSTSDPPNKENNSDESQNSSSQETNDKQDVSVEPVIVVLPQDQRDGEKNQQEPRNQSTQQQQQQQQEQEQQQKPNEDDDDDDEEEQAQQPAILITDSKPEGDDEDKSQNSGEEDPKIVFVERLMGLQLEAPMAKEGVPFPMRFPFDKVNAKWATRMRRLTLPFARPTPPPEPRESSSGPQIPAAAAAIIRRMLMQRLLMAAVQAQANAAARSNDKEDGPIPHNDNKIPQPSHNSPRFPGPPSPPMRSMPFGPMSRPMQSHPLAGLQSLFRRPSPRREPLHPMGPPPHLMGHQSMRPMMHHSPPPPPVPSPLPPLQPVMFLLMPSSISPSQSSYQIHSRSSPPVMPVTQQVIQMEIPYPVPVSMPRSMHSPPPPQTRHVIPVEVPVPVPVHVPVPYTVSHPSHHHYSPSASARSHSLYHSAPRQPVIHVPYEVPIRVPVEVPVPFPVHYPVPMPVSSPRYRTASTPSMAHSRYGPIREVYSSPTEDVIVYYTNSEQDTSESEEISRRMPPRPPKFRSFFPPPPMHPTSPQKLKLWREYANAKQAAQPGIRYVPVAISTSDEPSPQRADTPAFLLVTEEHEHSRGV